MLRYSDDIAHTLRTSLQRDIETGATYVKGVSAIKMDLHPTEGYMLSTARVLTVTDINGNMYRVTVEEMP